MMSSTSGSSSSFSSNFLTKINKYYKCKFDNRYDLDHTYCGVGGSLRGAQHLHDPVLQFISGADRIADICVRPLGDHGRDDAEELFGERAHLLDERFAEVIVRLGVVHAVGPAQEAKAL